MNQSTIVLIVIAILGIFIFGALLKQFRRAFLVPEGYVGLLYHKGKFIEVLNAGRHIRWGLHYNLDAQDLRKTSLIVAGQDVLTADNVGLKLSLLLTYQITDAVKAAHETQNWHGNGGWTLARY